MTALAKQIAFYKRKTPKKVMASIPLPYFAPGSELPQPLPSHDEITSLAAQAKDDYSSRTTLRIGPFFIKYGQNVNLIEGQNMLFVRSHTVVLVPRVYAIYTDLKTNVNYIIMEYIDGNTLGFEWGLLSEKQKERIARQLRCYMDDLRAIPSPGYYGSIGRRGLLDGIFWTGDDGYPDISGPFENEGEFNDAMWKKYVYSSLPPAKADFYRDAFPVVLRDHGPSFTHGDFQRKNIMIRRIPLTQQERSPMDDQGSLDEETFVLTVIDWEFAGWYPSYWDFALALTACGRWGDDWHVWVRKILDPFLNEFVWMQMLRNELWS